MSGIGIESGAADPCERNGSPKAGDDRSVMARHIGSTRSDAGSRDSGRRGGGRIGAREAGWCLIIHGDINIVGGRAVVVDLAQNAGWKISRAIGSAWIHG